MWEDASGLLLWMSQSAYPSFVWQTYDYYHDATGAYWGAKYACEPLHIQWNASNNSVKAINTTSEDLKAAVATTRVFTLDGKELAQYGRSEKVNVSASDKTEAYRLNLDAAILPLHFIKLELKDSLGNMLSENFYWRNGEKDLDYTALNNLPDAELTFTLLDRADDAKQILIKNQGNSVAFGNRLRLVREGTQERVLPVLFSDNYFTLMPGEEKTVQISDLEAGQFDLLWKQYGHKEEHVLVVK
jgi:hypothetical protein